MPHSLSDEDMDDILLDLEENPREAMEDAKGIVLEIGIRPMKESDAGGLDKALADLEATGGRKRPME